MHDVPFSKSCMGVHGPDAGRGTKGKPGQQKLFPNIFVTYVLGFSEKTTAESNSLHASCGSGHCSKVFLGSKKYPEEDKFSDRSLQQQ